MIYSDKKIREQALDTRGSFIVQAPAGSGKTEILIQRCLALLSISNKPEEILCITFTNKSAYEMQIRILSALKEASTNDIPKEPHKLITYNMAKKVLLRNNSLKWNLIENPNRLNIMTIDSFAFKIVQSMPILTTGIVENHISNHPLYLYRMAASKTVKMLESNNIQVQKNISILLNNLNNNVTYLEDLLSNMLVKREQWLPYIMKIKNDDMKKILSQSLQSLVHSSITNLIDIIPHSLLLEINELANYSLLNIKDEFENNIPSFMEEPIDTSFNILQYQYIAGILFTGKGLWRKSFTKKQGFPTSTDKNIIHSKEYMKEKKNNIIKIVGELKNIEGIHSLFLEIIAMPSVLYNENQFETLQALIEILPILVAQLNISFNEFNSTDFNEINIQALNCLGNQENISDVALYMDYQINHLLIDEFQDTSIIHYKLFECIVSQWSHEDNRTIFAVGDPMQSIYRFREADVSLFLQTSLFGIGEISLKYLNLSTNFRSCNKIVHWINSNFDYIFPKVNNISLGAVKYTSAIPIKPNTNSSSINNVFCNTLSDEAIHICKSIIELKRETPHESVVILARNRKILSIIINQLIKKHLNYIAIDIDKLIDKSIIIDLLSLTKGMLLLSDSLSWLSILRAPWCGLTLDDLNIISDYTYKYTILEIINNDHIIKKLSLDGQIRLIKINRILKFQYNNRDRFDLHSLIYELWLSIGGPACVKDESELEYAMKFFKCINIAVEEQDYFSFEYLEEKLANTYISETSTAENPIQVMTIHKSKGLEFDHVFIAGCNNSSKNNKQPMLQWMQFNSGSDVLLAPIKNTNEKDSSIYKVISFFNNSKDTEELKRLLYVASTRAKQSLSLYHALNYENKKEQKISPSKNSFTEFMWPCLEKEFKSSTLYSYNNVVTEEKKSMYRIDSEWESPLLTNIPEVLLSKFSFLDMHTQNNKTTFGEIFHEVMYLIPIKGLSFYMKIDKSFWIHLLNKYKISSIKYNDYIKTIKTILYKIKQCSIGTWLIDNNHLDSSYELEINYINNTKIEKIIIDRTFLENDIRWIVDYKFHTESTLPDNIIEKYKPKMHKYAHQFTIKERKKIKLGLYLPLISKWYSWDYE